MELSYQISGGKLGPLENKVLDILGRESARILALKTPDMQVGHHNSQANTLPDSQSVPGPSIEQLVEEASLIFTDHLTNETTGSLRYF